jgi:hypothetical protein
MIARANFGIVLTDPVKDAVDAFLQANSRLPAQQLLDLAIVRGLEREIGLAWVRFVRDRRRTATRLGEKLRCLLQRKRVFQIAPALKTSPREREIWPICWSLRQRPSSIKRMSRTCLPFQPM